MLRCKDLKSLPSLGKLRYLTGTRGARESHPLDLYAGG